ncbi:helix-turn-helix transcriptional regulator [Streptomyces mobaraensis]|uniref:helix-turn-helix domain-containing protein n=1 Tax=Streptomyces mobaraensis TaxID=35621 RepID=UPI00331BEC2F
MKNHTPPSEAGVPLTVGRWLHDELESRGYNLSQRGGGRRRFADLSGVPVATLSRVLRDDGGADPGTLRKIAEALGVPLTPLLVLANVIPEAEFQPRAITTDEALAALGVTKPAHKAAVLSMVRALLDDENEGGSDTKQ